VVKITEIMADVLEIPIEELSSSSNLEELGVDSLLATELFSELNKRFGVFISHTDFATITDVQGLARLVFGSQASDAIALTPPPHGHSAKPAKGSASFDIETFVFAERDGIPLSADIYYPEGLGDSQRPLAVGT
jgi:acyl carrier protein